MGVTGLRGLPVRGILVDVVDAGPFLATQPAPGWADFWSHYATGEWEPEVSELVRDLVKPGHTFIDVGAWCGPHALLAASLDARVIALEPDPIAAQSLRWNVEVNSFTDQVTVVPAALVNESGPVYLAAEGSYGSSASRVAFEGIVVPGLTLPALLGFYGVEPGDVSLLKMDIEGGEFDLWLTLGPQLAERGIPACVAIHGEDLPCDWSNGFATVERLSENEWVFLP
jgi:FkbM family methyltransferase